MRFCVPFPFMPPNHLLPLARAAEEAGFDSLAVPDAVFYPEHVSAKYQGSPDGQRFWAPDSPSVEPFVALAAFAAATTTIGLTTNVVKLPIRHPLLVAKQLTSIAALADGRVSLGVGLSWVPEEYAFSQVEWTTRAARFEEMIAVLRLACAGGGPRWIEHHGEHFDFDRLMISPSPQQPVPIIVGGHSRAALSRAARIADGWVGGRMPVEQLVASATTLRELRHELGTADRPFSIAGQIAGPLDEGLLALLTEAGLTEVQVLPWLHRGGDPTALETRLASLHQFAEDFLAR